MCLSRFIVNVFFQKFCAKILKLKGNCFNFPAKLYKFVKI